VSDIGNEELQRHFEAMRDVDLAELPSFAELSRQRVDIGRERRLRARWLLAGAAGAMAAAAMLAVLAHQRQEEAWLRAAAEISRWQAPSDALLDHSHGSLLGTSAVLSESVLDSIIGPPPSHEE
jgi:hypothetical protein